MNDVVIDTNVARLFDAPADIRLRNLFRWLTTTGHLAVSQHLLNEYHGHGNRLLAILIRDLQDQQRLNKIPTASIKTFADDKHYSYCCNSKDIPNARTVFLSRRKLLVSFDKLLRKDVNGFRKIDGIQPHAMEYPPDSVLC